MLERANKVEMTKIRNEVINQLALATKIGTLTSAQTTSNQASTNKLQHSF